MNNSKARILIIEDEKSMREILKILLEEEAYDVTSVSDGQKGIALINTDIFDLILTDIKMPRADGFAVLRKAKEISPETIVIMITAFGTTEAAIEAMKMGAYDYIHKPFKIDEIRIVVNKALERKNLNEELTVLRTRIQSSFGLENIIGKSAEMQELFKLMQKVALSSSTVLITGESGSGKELVANAIHNLSHRRDKKFMTINCATFPEGLLESELFGHMKGSFTGALQNKSGLIEIAHEGSIFLDEIGEMPLSLQAKLLRVLENGSFRRVGGTTNITVDVRVIAATNKNIQEAVTSGTFREDLYYRLNVVPIHLPPLRDRREDIPLLIEHFLNKMGAQDKKISSDALNILVNYHWKGNVRELENIVERLVLLFDKEMITPADIPQEISMTRADTMSIPKIGEEGLDLVKVIEDIEKNLLLKALKKANGVKTEAAKLLHLSFRSFRHKLYKHGIK